MLVAPHGGFLVDRVAPAPVIGEMQELAAQSVLIRVSLEKLKECQNIAHGVFSPLQGFMTGDDLRAVVESNRLPSGEYWTIPILLAVPDEIAAKVTIGDTVGIAGEGGGAVALMDVHDVFSFDSRSMAKSVFGTDDVAHPGVAKLFQTKGRYVGGPITLFGDIPLEHASYYFTPKETRQKFADLGWSTVVAFQTRNPPHRAHEYLQKCALEICDGLFINPVIGQKKRGDFTDDVILDSYQRLIDMFYPTDRVLLAILPWEMRYAGPKEAIFHGIVRKNFGCSHHIIGRDHAGVGTYYDTFAAQTIFDDFPGLGIEPLCFENSFFCKACEGMGTSKTCPHGGELRLNPSGTKIRAIVTEHADIHPGIMRPEIAKILADAKSPFVE